MNNILTHLGNVGIIPVIAIDDADDAVALGGALLAGNLPCAEITFRTAAAAQAIEKMSAAHPDICVGAGTVLTVAQAETAKAAGAQFVVTPGFDEAVVDWCLANDMPITPGVMTPTEINMALNKGLSLMKFFPAEAAGGIQALKAIGGPYAGVTFIPTGGINANNLTDYLNLPMVHACGGSFMVKKNLIATKRFDEIEKLAAAAAEIVRSARAE